MLVISDQTEKYYNYESIFYPSSPRNIWEQVEYRRLKVIV